MTLVAFVESRLGRKRNAKLVLNFIDRVLGHGGFAGDTITITYMDRDYPAGSFANVVRHEAAHILARPLGKERPILIEEGFATYITGGHFKPEPFAPRAAGLVALDRYIPLAQLADNFYPAQHETGYLESAGFIEYLVNTYGWEKFVTLLGAFQQTRNESAMLDAGLRFTYNKNFRRSSRIISPISKRKPIHVGRATLKIRFVITTRCASIKRNSIHLPITSTAWIPDIDRAVRDGLTADYQRHPLTPRHIAIETMLIEADRGIDSGDYDLAERYLTRHHQSSRRRWRPHRSSFVSRLLGDRQTDSDEWLRAATNHIRKDNVAIITVKRNNASPSLIQMQMTRLNGAWKLQ